MAEKGPPAPTPKPVRANFQPRQRQKPHQSQLPQELTFVWNPKL